MRLTKTQRASLREKFGGRCAYCGSPLGERWHADHIEPIVRNDWFSKIGMENEPPSHPERDTLENMNPACPPCNIDKHSMSLESWRSCIQRGNEGLMRDVGQFRRAVRFGTVSVVDCPVVFYFERIAQEQGGSDGGQN